MRAVALMGALLVAGCNSEKSMDDVANRLRSDLVYIAGGTFQPGNYVATIDGAAREIGQTPARPTQETAIDGFYLAAHLPTVADYLTFREATGRPAYDPDLPTEAAAPMPFHEAEAYCAWLGEITSLPVRLPTEAEWEFAARNRGEAVAYGTDDGTWDPPRNVWMPPADAGLFPPPPPPGSLPPSPLGLHDLHGVWNQWVGDRGEDDAGDVRIAKGSAADEDGRMKPIPARWAVPPTDRGILAITPGIEPLFPDGEDAIHRGSASVRCAVAVSEPPSESGLGR